jgi:hypothetical protein
MKRLDSFLDSGRYQMDPFEPPEGHLIRFQEKLNRNKKISYTWIRLSAAIFLIGVIISVSLLYPAILNKPELPFELKQTADYYNGRYEKLKTELQNNVIISSVDKQAILKDIKELDKEYNKLFSDYKKFPGDERVYNAFIVYYKSRTEFLEEILTQLSSSSNVLM